jgi:hypothetical protein
MIIKRAVVQKHIPIDKDDPNSYKRIGFYTVLAADGWQGVVEHTSPYYDRTTGFVALPPENSQILICKTDDGIQKNTWYYLSTIVTPQPGERFGSGSDQSRPIESAIGKLGVPTSVALTGPGEHTIQIKHDYDQTKMESGVYLKTSGGKLVRLEDGPDKNNIVIKTAESLLGSMASIEIQERTPEGSSRPSYSITLYATGSVNLVSKDSNIAMEIIDGGKIDIVNRSSGLMRTSPIDPTCGSINIKSTNGDINIVAGPEIDPATGAPLVVSPAAAISAVNIRSVGSPTTSLNIHTDGILNLSGKSGVHITGGDLRFGLTGVSPVRMDGLPILLNPPA